MVKLAIFLRDKSAITCVINVYAASIAICTREPKRSMPSWMEALGEVNEAKP